MNRGNTIKFYVFICLFILNLQLVSAQDYKAIKTDGNYYFYDSINKDILVAPIDSASVTSTETRYFGMHQIRQASSNCYTPKGASWLGDVVTESPSGTFSYISYPSSPPDSADIYTVQTKAALNQTWHFYNLHTINDYIEAKITSVEQRVILGFTDSVKVITLQRKNAAGQIVTNPINGKKILLSKNYGLIRLPKFDEFKNNLRFLDLCGKSNPVTGRTNLLFEEIFDFQPGDEFDIAFDYTPYANYYPHEWGYIIQRILERINGSTTDTVSYKIAECKTKTFSPGMNQQTITNLTDTIIVKYVKSNYPEFAFEPKEPQISPIWMHEMTQNEMGLSVTSVLGQAGIPWKMTHATWPLWTNNQQCWYYAIIDDYINSEYYYKGLGGPYHYWMSAWANTNFRKLVYYKKGAQTWGTPYNCEALLNTGIDDGITESGVRIFPNPVIACARVVLPANVILPVKIEIYELTGKYIKSYELNAIDQVTDFSDLPSGMFILRFVPAEGTVRFAKIIRQ